MPKKENGAQGRKRRAQFEAFLNESRKFTKKNFKSSGCAKRQSADIRRQDESAGADNHRIVKHRGRKIFVCPGAQDILATPLAGPLTRPATPSREFRGALPPALEYSLYIGPPR